MDVKDRVSQLVAAARVAGDGWLKSQIVKWIMPHVMRVFSERGAADVRKMILANYPLVEKELPDGVKDALRSLGSDPRTRDTYEQIVLGTVTPDNILHWLREPDDWLDDDAPDEVREELVKTAETIEETYGGREWLEAQVIQLYEYAGVVPRAPAEGD